MADRDVRLIIRAKDAASKAIDSVAKALEDVKNTAKLTDSQLGETGSVLSELGTEFRRLNSEISGLNALSKVSAQIDNASKAVARLKDDAKQSGDALNDLTSKLQTTQKQASDTAAKIKETNSALQAQRQATAESRKANADATSELSKAETAYAKLAKAVRNKGDMDARAAKLTAAADRITTAQDTSAATSAAYNQQLAVLKQLEAEYATLTTQAKALGREETNLAGDVERATVAHTRANDALAKGESALNEIKVAANGVAQALGGVSISEEKLAATTAETNAALKQTEQMFAAIQRFSGGEGVFTDPKTAAAMRAQREEVARAEANYKLLNDQVARLRANMAAGGPPSREQAQALREVGAAAAQARQELIRQTQALQNLNNQASRGTGLRGIFKGVYGESRQAMSLLQRVRGEVLSLTTSYLGLYAAIQNIGGLINAYRAIEAAENRLGAVFEQNRDAVGNEMAWLERQAARLGYSFQTLSDSYTKFAVAAKNSNFTVESTRKIFIALTEAGRVNKLSTDAMGRAFLALEQIISKGKFSAEEVRRQLGEALPGAYNILAKSLGLTAAQLDDMMRKGQLFSSESNLLKFADGLTEAFGSQLPEALTTVTTLLGQFSNDLFQAQNLVNKGGFIESLRNFIQEMHGWFNSREGRDFFLSLGAAAGNFIDLLSVLAQNVDLVIFAIKALIALKAGQWFMSLADSAVTSARNLRLTSTELQAAETRGFAFAAMNEALRARVTAAVGALAAYRANIASLSLGMAAARVGQLAWSGAIVATSGVVRALTIGVRALWAAVGGWVGVLTTAVSFLVTSLLGSWIAGVDKATEALDVHDDVMQRVLSKYEEIGKTSKDWLDQVEDINVDTLNASIRDLQNRMYDLTKEADDFQNGIVNATKIAFDPERSKIADYITQFRNAEISAKDFAAGVREVYKATNNDSLRQWAEKLLKVADEAAKTEKAMGSLALVARDKGSTMKGLNEIIDRTGVSYENLSKPIEGATDAAQAQAQAMEQAAEAVAGYGKALDDIRGFIPELADDLKKLSDYAKLDEAYESALKYARTMGDVLRVTQEYNRAREAISDKYTNFEAVYTGQRGTPAGNQMDEIVKQTVLISKQLGVSAKDLLTAISYETGGTFNPRVMGGAGGKYYGLIQFSPDNQKQYGLTGNESIADQLKAVGDYLEKAGVKAGDGLLQIYAAINAGSANRINASDEANGGMPGTVLDKVNNQMEGHAKRAEGVLASFAGTVDQAEELYKTEEKARDDFTKSIEDTIKASQKANEETNKSIEEKKLELSVQKMIADGKGREAAIEQAINEAKEKNKGISQEQIAALTDIVGKLYDQEHRLDAVKKKEEEINNLTAIRESLMAQIEYYQNQGNTDKAEELKGKLTEVNSQLSTSIDAAIAMWQALGGPEADVAIAKLQQAKLGLTDLGNNAVISGKQINDMIANGFVSAFDAFAQAIANGENAFEALKNAALKALGEILVEIGKAIVQAAILKALTGSTQGGSGGAGGFIAGLIGAMFHEGGTVGEGGTPRVVSPGWFANAKRYHNGGIAGLQPGEVPAVLREGEVVDPGDGSVFAQTFGQAQRPVVKVVNSFDSGDVVSEGLATPRGEETFLNMVRSNSSAVKQALGLGS